MDGVYQPKCYLFFSIFYKMNMKGFHIIKSIFLEYKKLSLNDILEIFDVFNIRSMLIASNANNIELNIQM